MLRLKLDICKQDNHLILKHKSIIKAFHSETEETTDAVAADEERDSMSIEEEEEEEEEDQVVADVEVKTKRKR